MKQELISQARSAFQDAFGGDPSYVVWAPGRVNLIGEHTDYHLGTVFPCAVDRGLVIAARLSDRTRLISPGFPEVAPFELIGAESLPAAKWVRYALGVPVLWSMEGFSAPQVDAVVVSDLPQGAGLSSSAAIESGFALLFQELIGLSLSSIDLAKICQKSENTIVGAPCGLMDQLACIHGVKGKALFIDLREPIQVVPTSLPKDVSIVVCDTGEKHDIGESGYPLRRRQSEDAAKMLGVSVLREATVQQCEEAKDRLGDVLYRRAKHVVTEIDRCFRFRDALEANDLGTMGALMAASHASLRDDYEVSSQALDITQRIASEHEACYGVRMTGGGFGGACVAIVRSSEEQSFSEWLEGQMKAAGIANARCFPCSAYEGTRFVN